jgi:hypothetical protein
MSQKLTSSPRRLGVAVGAGVLLVALSFFTVYGTAFGNPSPRNLPVLVVGNAELAAQLDAQDEFAAETVASVDEAREQLLDREAYGAIAPQDDGSISLLLASGKGRSGAATLSTAVSTLAANSEVTVTVEDVVPLSDDNPGGSFEFYLVVFLGLAGGAGASVLSRVLHPVRGSRGLIERVGFLAAYTAVAATAFTVVAGVALGALPGEIPALFAVLWAYTFATSLALSGIQAAFGTTAAIGASLLLTVFGNATAAGPVVREALPAFYQALHPFLPHGAALDILRGVQYFDGAGIGAGILTLAIWGGLGLAALTVTAHRSRSAPDTRPDDGPRFGEGPAETAVVPL